MRCPVCPDERLVVSERSGVEIDYCPHCRGVWLDRGELDKILDRAAASPAPAMPPPGDRYRRHEDDRYRSGYGHRKKRRSFLDDLFDFD